MNSAMGVSPYYGWRVVAGTFVLAAFGMGLGFHGPAIYLHTVHETRGWSLALISSAVTLHFLIGAIVTANLPLLYKRLGIAAVTKAGAVLLALGIVGWATALAPWQLFVAAVFSGAGWVTMGVASINAIVSPWFERARPRALALAYNGANVGGVIFSPLWVMAIASLGFPMAAVVIVLVMIATMWALADFVFSKPPAQVGVPPDDGQSAEVSFAAVPPIADRLQGALLWRDLRFVTLTLGMAFGLFAQIGLISHLFSLLVPALGSQWAGFAMGLVTACAIVGRTLIGWLLPPAADWRVVASLSYVLQIIGSVVFILAAGTNVPLLVLGTILFGLGFGNGTWLPPLIAHAEFAKEDVLRVVALAVAISQATYAFAPLTFGLVREFTSGSPLSGPGAAHYFFALVALVQAMAMASFMAGRRR